MRTFIALAVAGAGVASTLLAAPAHAADVRVYSDSHRSVLVYDDSANTITACDLVDGDGVGAFLNAHVNGSGFVDTKRYNGCSLLMTGIREGSRIELEIADWVPTGGGGRTATGWGRRTFYDS